MFFCRSNFLRRVKEKNPMFAFFDGSAFVCYSLLVLHLKEKKPLNIQMANLIFAKNSLPSSPLKTCYKSEFITPFVPSLIPVPPIRLQKR